MSEQTIRELYEQAQAAWLAPYATHEAESGGRKFPESEHPYRTVFQRDRDRVMHCTAFRRLDFKMQVFMPHQHDHLRTRMTHTLEVAQIGRTIGRALRLNEDLIETVALAHDLGHPPFGHDGETVLNELMAGAGGFEHNQQSLRVVDYLEHPYPRFRGLNLSQVVRECLARHETRYDHPAASEFDRSLAGPLEGQLVDLADGIAYTSADLEDALGVEWLTAEGVSGLMLWQRAWQVAQEDCPDARPIHKQIRACKAVLSAMADDAIRTTGENLRKLSDENGCRGHDVCDHAEASKVVGVAANVAVTAPGTAGTAPGGVAANSAATAPDDATAPNLTLDAIRRCGRRVVGFSSELAKEVDQMRDFLMEHVYVHPLAEEQKIPCRRMIRELFGAFTSQPGLLPPRYQQRVGDESLHRVVCDYIAGMTDRYCRLEHERVVGTPLP